MTLTPETFSLVALGLSLASLVFTVLIYVKIGSFFKQGNAKSFEDMALQMVSELEGLKKFRTELMEYITVLEKRLTRSMQVALSKRYNPFKGTGEGGLQSHSTALLSENGDGVMISALGTRDRVSVFAKPLEKFESKEVELTPEEKEILEEARKLISL